MGKDKCDFNGFTFTGNDNKTYGYDEKGAPCTTNVISTTSANDVAADKWGNIANKPFQPISMGPPKPLIKPLVNINLTPSLSNTNSPFQPSFQPTPSLSLPQPKIYPNIIKETPHASGVKLPASNTQQIFENDFDNTGVMNYSGGATADNIKQLSHLINVRGTMPNGWGPNVFKNLKILNLSGNNLSGTELSPLFQSIYYQKIDLDLLDLGHNRICDNSVGEMLWSIGNESGKQIHAIRCLKINNNQIGDPGAEYISDAIAGGRLQALKHLDVSGNNITPNGHLKLMEAMESPSVKSILITLVKNITSLQSQYNKAAKATIDFVTKGLKYTVEQHNLGLKGTKWDETTVRTDSLDKWKNCKEVGQNVQKGFIGGLIKCGVTPKTPHAMFACVLKDVGMELLDPDTVWCVVEVNEFVQGTEVMGDCTLI